MNCRGCVAEFMPYVLAAIGLTFRTHVPMCDAMHCVTNYATDTVSDPNMNAK